MEKKLTYKGITLYINDFADYVIGEGKYAVPSNGRKFMFNSIAAFKNAVNGKSAYPEGVEKVPYLKCGEWGAIPIKQFREAII